MLNSLLFQNTFVLKVWLLRSSFLRRWNLFPVFFLWHFLFRTFEIVIIFPETWLAVSTLFWETKRLRKPKPRTLFSVTFFFLSGLYAIRIFPRNCFSCTYTIKVSKVFLYTIKVSKVLLYALLVLHMSGCLSVKQV